MNASGPVASELVAALEREGYRSASAPVGVARSLWEEISLLSDQGLLAKHMFDEYQDSWRLVVPKGAAEPRTLIVVAWQSVPLKLRFHTGEGPVDAVVPPTYIYSAGRSHCLETARRVLSRHGHEVWWATVPVKLLAARTGLARYGRNNLAYVSEFGSYVRLGAFCTDADLRAGGWETESATRTGSGGYGLSFMEECTNCRACSRACPTGCIPERGTVIDAAHCLTEANESEGDWPDWVPAGAHNCLVGCMRCQTACPVDRVYRGLEAEQIAEFELAETTVIMKGLPPERLPSDLRAKLADLDLDDYSSVLGRNLLALQATRN